MIKNLDHVAIAVRYLDEWLELFDRLFGLPASRREPRPGVAVKSALVSAGKSSIEVVQPTEPGSPVASRWKARGEGVDYICLQVDDLEQEIQALGSKGGAR